MHWIFPVLLFLFLAAAIIVAIPADQDLPMTKPIFLLLKRGLYWGPDSCGYTGIKRQAGRYTYAEAAARVHDDDEPVTMIAEVEAPGYSPGCDIWSKAEDMNKQLAEKDAEITRLATIAADNYEVAMQEHDAALHQQALMAGTVQALKRIEQMNLGPDRGSAGSIVEASYEIARDAIKAAFGGINPAFDVEARVADERGACAKIAEEWHIYWKHAKHDVTCDATACEDIAAAIRART